MPDKSLFMESTKVSMSQSVAEITRCLVQGGARSIHTEFDEEGKITGIQWTVSVGANKLSFKMPARVDVVYKTLLSRGAGSKETVQARAERIAWRQLLRWVQVQMAMIDMGMAEMAEVFFAYNQPTGEPSGETLYNMAKASQFKLLSPGTDRLLLGPATGAKQ